MVKCGQTKTKLVGSSHVVLIGHHRNRHRPPEEAEQEQQEPVSELANALVWATSVNKINKVDVADGVSCCSRGASWGPGCGSQHRLRTSQGRLG